MLLSVKLFKALLRAVVFEWLESTYLSFQRFLFESGHSVLLAMAFPKLVLRLKLATDPRRD